MATDIHEITGSDGRAYIVDFVGNSVLFVNSSKILTRCADGSYIRHSSEDCPLIRRYVKEFSGLSFREYKKLELI